MTSETPLDGIIRGPYAGFALVLLWFIGLYHLKLVYENGWPGQITPLILDGLPCVLSTSALMYLGMFPSFFLQFAVKRQWLQWPIARVVSSLYEVAFIVMSNVAVKDQSWLVKLVIVLHSFAQLMKVHSYSFTNGNLEDKKHITLHGFFMFTMYPTLVYEPAFPRNDNIRYKYLLTKLTASILLFACAVINVDLTITPAFIEILHRSDPSVIAYTIRLFPHVVMTCVVVFLLIWDALLSAIAEATMFADRDFYGPFWNSDSFLHFCKTWNKPVHKFLKKHIMVSGMSLGLSTREAMTWLFVISGLAHEVVFAVLLNKWRWHFTVVFGSFGFSSLYQDRDWINRNRLACNSFFALLIVLAPTLIAVLYLIY